MNGRKIHLPFKLPNFGEARLKDSRRVSQPRNLEGPHINPRVRAYGKARLDIARRVQTQQDWDALWRPPTHPFPFSFSVASSWKLCIEYRVDDFAAEVGFWIDILGLQVTAFGPDYVQFSSPGGEFTFAVTSALENQSSTPPDSLRIQFSIKDLMQTVEELEHRSLSFDQPPVPQQPDSLQYYATFSTPHGIAIDLWGEVETAPVPVEVPIEQQAAARPAENSRAPQDLSSTLPGNLPSLDLYTWDEDEADQNNLPEFTPAAKVPLKPVTNHSSWPISPDIATELMETRRSRHVAEDNTAYTVEPTGNDPDQVEEDDLLAEWDKEGGPKKSGKESEDFETITYEPIE